MWSSLTRTSSDRVSITEVLQVTFRVTTDYGEGTLEISVTSNAPC